MRLCVGHSHSHRQALHLHYAEDYCVFPRNEPNLELQLQEIDHVAARFTALTRKDDLNLEYAEKDNASTMAMKLE